METMEDQNTFGESKKELAANPEKADLIFRVGMYMDEFFKEGMDMKEACEYATEQFKLSKKHKEYANSLAYRYYSKFRKWWQENRTNKPKPSSLIQEVLKEEDQGEMFVTIIPRYEGNRMIIESRLNYMD